MVSLYLWRQSLLWIDAGNVHTIMYAHNFAVWLWLYIDLCMKSYDSFVYMIQVQTDTAPDTEWLQATLTLK